MFNLIETSDNLKTILNMERENVPILSEDDFKKNNNQKENSFDSQSLLSENNDYKQKMEDTQPKKVNKRQIGGGDSKTQVVVGTFQAIMRPASVPGLGGGGQSEEIQNEHNI